MAVELIVDAALVGPLTDALLNAGAQAVDVADANAGTDRERPVFQEPEDEVILAWGDNRMLVLFDENIDWRVALEQASAEAGLSIPSPQVARLEDQDWVRLTQSQFTPIQVSPRLWIVPSWSQAPDAAALNIALDPGLAFGTGSHPTTRLCLRWLDRMLKEGQTVIDYGCGSGVLAIAAARLGASRVTGVDIDSAALEASRYNARRNGVAVEFLHAAQPAPDPAHVVIANILAGPLKALAPLLAGLTRSHGHLILSGVLNEQVEEVAKAYRPWFDLQVGEVDEGWVRLEGAKQSTKRSG
jgi:ribosomal protein L11 methyltransferase